MPAGPTGTAGDADDGSINLVVLDDRCGGIGVAVRQILDVAAAESMLQSTLAATGVAGTLAVGGLATEVLDLSALVAATETFPDVGGSHAWYPSADSLS
jgi:hypothetical protein